MISPGFFVFSKFWFFGLLGGGGWGEGAKRQKMDKMFWFFWLLVGLKCKKCPKMIKWCLSHCISQDARITRFWFLVHMCKIMTSPDFFFHFLKILIFWIVRGVKVKNGQKWQRMMSIFLCIHLYGMELYLIWLCFLVHMCKIMISPTSFYIFSKFWFFVILGG